MERMYATADDFKDAKVSDFSVIQPGSEPQREQENVVEEVVQQQPQEQPVQQQETIVEKQPEVIVQQPARVEEPVKQDPPKSWKELLIEQGFDQHDIDLITYRKEKGNVIPYLEATSINFQEMPADELMRRKLQKEYPNLKGEAFDILYREEVIEKYKLDTDLHEGPQVEVGKARLNRDAETVRQQFLDDQAKYRIPERQIADEAQSRQEAVQQATEQLKQTITTNAATQRLLQDKRLVLDGGEEGMQFQFEVENPQDAVEMLYNGEKYQQYITTPDGQPDVQKLLLMGAVARDPQKVFRSLINYGKSLGSKSIIDKDFVNADGKEHGAPQATEETLWDAFRSRGVKKNGAAY